MAQITLNSTGVASNGALVLQSNGTTTAVTINASQGVEFNAGTAALPAITTTGDTNTGIFFPAADTIAFTEGGVEAMRLDSSGNLGLGVTPPTSTDAGNITIKGGSSLNFSTASGNMAANATFNSGWKYIATAAAVKYTQSGAEHQWFNAASGTAGNAISFTQAMTLDASGNLLVGDTSAAGRILAKSATSDGTTSSYVAKNSSGTVLLDIISTGYFKTGVAANSPFNNATGSSANVFVGSDGALFRSTSSLKYKTNVQDATHGLAEVLKLRPVTYEGKSDFDAGKTFGGLIAEEVHDAGLTEFVQYADDGSPDALAYSNMVALLTKAIQEQQALITALTARITALESN